MRATMRVLITIFFVILVGVIFMPNRTIAAAVDFTQLESLTDQEFVELVNIYQADHRQLDLILIELHRRFPIKEDRLKAIAEMYLGAKYYTEPFVDELADPLPYTRTNCTMFVIYAATFLNSSSYDKALENVKKIHYHDGLVGYKTRYHFTTDRITDPENRYFTEATEQYVSDPSVLWKVSINLNVKQSGGYLLEGLDGWSKPVTVKYIRRKDFTVDKLKYLPRTLGVAFVKKSNWPIGVVVGHEGILIDGDLYHSGSPSTGLYRIDNYFSEVFPGSDWEGVIFFQINEVN